MSLDQRTSFAAPADGPTLRERALRKLVSRFLPAATSGHLTLVLPSRDKISCGVAGSGPHVSVEIKRWRALWKLAFQGDNGFASAYEDGDITTGDLLPLFEFSLRNRTDIEHSIRPSKLGLMIAKAQHALNRNSRKGSRRNISAHYDLGNEFYRTWLDQGMNYSSAIYGAGKASLEAVQKMKIKRIVALLKPKAGASVLEIGCGWGALMEELVRRQKCKVTGLTLSHEQAAYANERLAPEIAEGAARIDLKDYRDSKEQYDRVVSIEMIEAVGEAYWPTYFSTLRNSLKRGGIAVVQAITIAEERFEGYRREPDFIQQRIFPGGMLLTVSAIKKHAAAAGLDVTHIEHFGLSYAQTLAEWRRRFHLAWPKIQPLGFDERFRRVWDYYLAYCEAGFRHKATDVGLYVFSPKAG